MYIDAFAYNLMFCFVFFLLRCYKYHDWWFDTNISAELMQICKYCYILMKNEILSWIILKDEGLYPLLGLKMMFQTCCMTVLWMLKVDCDKMPNLIRVRSRIRSICHEFAPPPSVDFTVKLHLQAHHPSTSGTQCLIHSGSLLCLCLQMLHSHTQYVRGDFIYFRGRMWRIFDSSPSHSLSTVDMSINCMCNWLYGYIGLICTSPAFYTAVKSSL